MATITVTVPDEVKLTFDARAKALKSQSGDNFADGAELILEFIEGHLVTAAQEVKQAAANKEFAKEARRVRRLLHPDEED